MKKLSFLSMALLAGSAVSAQSTIQVSQPLKPTKTVEVSRVTPSNGNINRATAFFTEDFANGLAGNNGSGAWTVSGPDAALWQQDFDGPNGNFSNPATQIIQSPTVANGFMIFDADLSNSNPVSGTTRAGSLISPVIDLTNETSVVVNFHQAYRYCCANAHALNLEVSTDGGATYPNVFKINAGVSGNQYVSGEYAVNVTQIAAGQSQVVLKFTWGAGTASHYFWQLDDISLDVAPDNDLELLAFEVLNGDTVGGGIQQNYSLGQEPDFMAESRWFIAVVKNNSDNAKDAYLTLDIDNGSLITVGGAASAKSVAGYGAIDTLYIGYEPAVFEVAHYDVVGNVHAVGVADSSDAKPANNQLPSRFTITSDVLAVNSGNYTGLRSHTNLFDTDDDAGTDDEILAVDYFNRWINFEAIEIIGVRTAFIPESKDGASFTYGVYDLDASGLLDKGAPFYTGQNLEPDGFGGVQDRGIDSSMNGSVSTYMFQFPKFNDQTFETELIDTSVVMPETPEGALFGVAISLTGGDTAGIYGTQTGVGQGNRQTSLQTGPFDPGGALATYLSPGINIIELLLKRDTTISIAEYNNSRPDFYLAQNRPNPFNGNTTVTYQLNKKASNITFEVFDVTGKQVMNLNEGSKGAGQYNIELNSSEFTTGLYYYSLTVNGQKLTRKMVITE